MRLRRKTVSLVPACVVLVPLTGCLMLAQSFVVTPSMSLRPTYTSAKKTGQPAQFVSVSSSGSTIEAVLGDLDRLVRQEIGEGLDQHRLSRSAMGVLLYAVRCDDREGQDDPLHCVADGTSDVENALAGLHGRLTFVDHIIASPVRATSTSECQEQGNTATGNNPARFTATLALINNPELEVYPFAVRPTSEITTCSSRLQQEHIGDNVRDAFKRAAHREAASGIKNPEHGEFSTVCLAFGTGEGQLDGGDPSCNGYACMSHVHRLNAIIRAASDGDHRCPVVASLSATDEPVLVSTRDYRTGECGTVAAGMVGAILSGRRDTQTSFQLVHAGKHTALHDSQFRIKRMRGGDIVEVEPVIAAQPSTTTTQDAATDFTRQLRCGGGVVSAAGWCRQVVSSSTFFEKVAMQSALGVGALKRAAADDGEHNDTNVSAAGEEAPSGLTRCFPAKACFEVAEVAADGSLRLAAGDTARLGLSYDVTGDNHLRAGDLCDFRAVGELAAMQAEQDAYAWLRAARLSALMEQPEDATTGSSIPGIQGCLVAGVVARVARGLLEEEDCEDLVRVAAGNGACPTVGLVSDVQLVSVDNEMVTCSADAGLAGVYFLWGAGTEC